MAILLTVWGLCAIGCGLARNWTELCVMRFLLGLAEGGAYPATLVLLSHWFPRGERARANAFWNLCLPLAVIISSPLSGWILDQWNWRTMLIASGVVPFVWMILWLIFVDDGPDKAKWISPAERDYLARTLAAEKDVRLPSGRSSFLGVLFSSQVLILVAVYFCFIFGSIGMLFWLPTALHKAAQGTNFFISVLYIVPFVVGAVAMVLNSLHSDKVCERRIHVAWALGGGGALFLGGVAVSTLSPVLSYALICLAGIGSFAPLGPFWAIPSETLPKKAVGSAIGLINAVGSLGGYFGPLVVGDLIKRTGSFQIAFSVLAIAMLIGGVMSLLLDGGYSSTASEGSAGSTA